MHAGDLVDAVEVGECARDPQHAVVTAGGEPHGVVLLPTRQRADLILKKVESHLVEEVMLRRL
jgi:hypothetical protein